MKLSLVDVPDAEGFLKVFRERAGPPGIVTRMHWDDFCRLGCSCGRHTFGPTHAADFTKDMLDDPWMTRKQSAIDYWFNTYQRSLQREAARFAKHDAQGRTAPLCKECKCETMVQVTDPALQGASHHQVCDLTRSCLDRADPDQYLLPADGKSLWQGTPFCVRMLRVYPATSQDATLIERLDGLWVFADVHNCSATPNYRCDSNSTKICWSDDFTFIWDTCMTAQVRQELWTTLTQEKAIEI